MEQIGCGYVRVSTEDQEEYSPDSQIRLLREYAKAHGIFLPDEFIFRDDGISGRKAEKRPEFMRMISMAKSEERPFSVILVWKFSRFARNQEESIVYKSLLKNQHSVDVISVSEPLPEGPFGSLVERIIEWTDEYYSIRLSGEVRRGMTERVSRGEAVTIAPFGYTLEDGKLLIDPHESAIVRMIYSDFLAGMSMHALAAKTQELGIRTKRGNFMRNRTIRYILTNPVYYGKLRWCPSGINNYTTDSPQNDDTMLVDGKHAPIITETIFLQVANQLSAYLKAYKAHHAKRAQPQDAGINGDFMLRGLMKCSACGSTMSRVKDGLQCCEYAHSGCRVSHYISMPKIEQLVLYTLQKQIANRDFKIIRKTPTLPTNKVEIIEKQIKKERNMLKRISEAYAAGIDTLEEYRDNKLRVQARLKKLEQALEATPKPIFDKSAYIEKIKTDFALLIDPANTATQKNQILRSFVDHITFSRPTSSVEIYCYT